MDIVSSPKFECVYCGEEPFKGHLCNKTPKWILNCKDKVLCSKCNIYFKIIEQTEDLIILSCEKCNETIKVKI